TTELLRALDAGLSPGLLERALTHRSYAYENGGLPTNERLEFLGDSVLGLVVTDALFRGYPDLPEGHLAKLRAAVVNMRALAGVARGLRLGDSGGLGRGEDGTGGRDKSSILADTLEAVIGAVYIERGLDEASALVHRLFDPVIARSARLGAGLDWKTSLQELTASGVLGVPEYHVEESGPDHQKSFRALVRVGGHVYGTGEGRSEQEAGRQAAEAAWNGTRDGGPPRDGTRHGDTAGGAPARPDNGVPATPRRAAREAQAGGDPGAGPAGRPVPELPQVAGVRPGLGRHRVGPAHPPGPVLHPPAGPPPGRSCCTRAPPGGTRRAGTTSRRPPAGS